jgi:hypothetical protein
MLKQQYITNVRLAASAAELTQQDASHFNVCMQSYACHAMHVKEGD